MLYHNGQPFEIKEWYILHYPTTQSGKGEKNIEKLSESTIEDILKLNKLWEVVHQIFWSLHVSW